MPTYEYKLEDGEKGCVHCANGFEVLHGMSEVPLERCPECGSRVYRAISAPGVKTGPSEKSILSDKNIKEHGFTKLVNEGDGRFRKI